ncbi:MAG: hypothetical protein HY268_00915 [Deltaproteobacteria bacterium]|nr:hypothetical protein [Deltaproteobacteria bacterium]
MGKDALRRKLVAEIGTLPEEDLPRILSLVGRLKTKRSEKLLSSTTRKNRDLAKNPLRGLLGIADVEPFAHNIDEELYGKRS